MRFAKVERKKIEIAQEEAGSGTQIQRNLSDTTEQTKSASEETTNTQCEFATNTKCKYRTNPRI